MSFFSLGKSYLVRVTYAEVVQARRHVGMFRAEMFFVNLERMQIIGLGRFLPSCFSKNQRDVVQHRAEIGIRQIFQLSAGSDCFFIITDRLFHLPEVVTGESEPAGRAVQRALIWR